MTGAADSPIEDYLDDLLRSAHADPRTTRRLIDEANDHLFSAAADLEAAGMTRFEAEREAVRRLGPASGVLQGSSRRSFAALFLEVLGASVLLGGCGLVAIGLSGAVAALMNALFGLRFVGGATVGGTGGHGVTETAQDAVTLRVLAGVLGLVVLAGYALFRRSTRGPTVLPNGLVDALGAAAFAAATVVLAGASVDQGMSSGAGHGVGFFLSGALVSLAGTVLFCARATRALLGHR
jgi:hypothetical protein